jgi:hypothetical protein
MVHYFVGTQNMQELSGEQARAALAAKVLKEKQLADLRAELKAETQFSRKAEISMKIKELQMKNWSVINDNTERENP